MPNYVTRISVWFNSEGASPAAIINKLLELGFTPIRGAYDFIYRHETNGEMEESDLGSAILEIANALHKTLSGFQVMYTLDTHLEEEDDYIPLEDIDKELEATREEISALEKEAISK